MTCRCSLIDGWTVHRLPDGYPSLQLTLLLQVTPLPASVRYQLLKQLLDCQRVDIALSQQTDMEDYLSQGAGTAEEKGIE